ncbi:E3 ubiquitin-protein ligase [Acrasis kona]|uniref:E3 ubiquitin-protein ligase n=1 Tax=Acrasis kona TaxID=1008807 RepID=A0AAW2Z0H2_9EUKA
MGNINDTIRDHVEREFRRVRTKGSEKEFLTINEAKKLNSMEDSPIDFKKLAVLFMLDVDKNGKFTLDDLLKFTEWCCSVTSHINNNDRQSFQSELQAQCTLNMWRRINTYNGRIAFCDWFVRLFAVGMIVKVPISKGTPKSIPKVEVKYDESSSDEDEDVRSVKDDDMEDRPPEATAEQNTQYSNKLSKRIDQLFLSVDTVTTLYEILNIKELYGISCQDLIDLMQRVGEDMGQLRLDNEALDNVIPAKVVHLFAENFATGFINMMSKLGFHADVSTDAYLSLPLSPSRIEPAPTSSQQMSARSEELSGTSESDEDEVQEPCGFCDDVKIKVVNIVI